MKDSLPLPIRLKGIFAHTLKSTLCLSKKKVINQKINNTNKALTTMIHCSGVPKGARMPSLDI
jgi:hypothetical protein